MALTPSFLFGFLSFLESSKSNLVNNNNDNEDTDNDNDDTDNDTDNDNDNDNDASVMMSGWQLLLRDPARTGGELSAAVH